MTKNPLRALEAIGQSVWLDFLRRGAIGDGSLARWIEEDGLRGVTSNPTIFEKAIGTSRDYDEAVRALALEGKSADEIFEAIAVEDIRRAADLFRATYERLEGRDGFVSIEVSPRLARDTEATVLEARHLFAAVARPNVMIKVPATREGLPAIARLTAEGINVNVTLLFGLERYEEVARAYLEGLERRAAKGERLDRVASVASFFLSRIDTLVDSLLEEAIALGGPRAEAAARLRGEAAIASARVAHEVFDRTFCSERFRRLAGAGARAQRLLWASTSSKNPSYPDLKYVEPLIGPETITTLPLETFEAYRDHGAPGRRLEHGADEARRKLADLRDAGVDMGGVARRLVEEGISKFTTSYDRLLTTLEERRRAALDRGPARRDGTQRPRGEPGDRERR